MNKCFLRTVSSEVFRILHGNLWSRISSVIEVQTQRMKMMTRMTNMKSLRTKRHQRRYFQGFFWSKCILCFDTVSPSNYQCQILLLSTCRLDRAKKDLQSLFQKHLFLIRRQNLLLPKRLVSCLDFECITENF